VKIELFSQTGGLNNGLVQSADNSLWYKLF